MVQTSCFRRAKAKWKQRLHQWSHLDSLLKLFVLITIVGLIAFAVVVVADHYRRTGERFSLLRGVSVWPSEIIMLAAGLLGVWSIVRLRTHFRDDIKETEAEFGLSHESFSKPEKYEDDEASSDQPVVATDEWREYVCYATLARRICKSIPYCVLFWTLLIILRFLVGWPRMPYRGSLSRATHIVLGFLAINALLVLLFVTVRAIKECLGLIKPMIDRETIWITDRFRDDADGPDKSRKKGDLADWLDIRLIAQMTERVGRLLYWPSVIVLLMMAARIAYFDNWDFPIVLGIIYAVPGAYIIGSAVGLQLTARRARTTALRRLRERLDDASFGWERNEERIKRIEGYIDEVTSMRQGAFRPLLENPVIHAILIPSGGLSFLTVLPYLLQG